MFRFLEKPMPLKEMVDAVRTASTAETEPGQRGLIPVVTVDSDGTIRYANERARELFETTSVGYDASRVSYLFDDDTIAELDATVEDWLKVVPRLALKLVKGDPKIGVLTMEYD